MYIYIYIYTYIHVERETIETGPAEALRRGFLLDAELLVVLLHGTLYIFRFFICLFILLLLLYIYIYIYIYILRSRASGCIPRHLRRRSVVC